MPGYRNIHAGKVYNLFLTLTNEQSMQSFRAALCVQRILRDLTVVAYGIVMDHGIINVLLNRNICNSLGREILFCLLEEFVIFLTPVSVIGMCLHMMSFKSSFHVSQMCEVIYSCLEENCGAANLSQFQEPDVSITMFTRSHPGHCPVSCESSIVSCASFGFIPSPRFIK
jgi:hypothetical protein